MVAGIPSTSIPFRRGDEAPASHERSKKPVQDPSARHRPSFDNRPAVGSSTAGQRRVSIVKAAPRVI